MQPRKDAVKMPSMHCIAYPTQITNFLMLFALGPSPDNG